MGRARAGNALPAPATSNPPFERAAGMDSQSRGWPDMDKPDTRTVVRADLQDHYAALRVESSASQQEIARAYRALMRKLHPDVDGGSPAGSPAKDSPAEPGRTEGKPLHSRMSCWASCRRSPSSGTPSGGRPTTKPLPTCRPVPVRRRNRKASPSGTSPAARAARAARSGSPRCAGKADRGHDPAQSQGGAPL